MGLVELSTHTGLSPAMLSKLERDLMHPTLPTLLRIAMVFSVGLEYFFNAEPKPVLEIVRRKERLRFPDSPDAKNTTYYFESLDFPAIMGFTIVIAIGYVLINLVVDLINIALNPEIRRGGAS